MEGTTGWKKGNRLGKEEEMGKREDSLKERRRWTNATLRATEGDYANGSQFDRSALQITAVLPIRLNARERPACRPLEYRAQTRNLRRP